MKSMRGPSFSGYRVNIQHILYKRWAVGICGSKTMLSSLALQNRLLAWLQQLALSAFSY